MDCKIFSIAMFLPGGCLGVNGGACAGSRAEKGVSEGLRKGIRVFLAGPGAIIVSLVVVGGMPLWLPRGAAGVDNLVLPLVLIPLIWAALFFHACLDRRLARVAVVAVTLFLAHGGLMAQKLLETQPAATESGR